MRLKSQFYNRLGVLTVREEDEALEAGSPTRPPDARPKVQDQSLDGSRPASNASGNDITQDTIEEVVVTKQQKLFKSVLAEIKAKASSVNSLQALLSGFGLTQLEMQDLMSTPDSEGWTLLHHAVYYGKIGFLKEFIQRGGDLNVISSDGWTPLLLSITRKQMECAKTLLASPDIQVNIPTKRGLPLHQCINIGNLELVRLLINAGADLHMKDNNGCTIYDYPMDEEIFMELAKEKEQGEPLKVEEFDDPDEEVKMTTIIMKPDAHKFRPPRPPLIKGKVYRFGGCLFRHMKRYLVVDPQEGTLIRYGSQEDYPMKPRQVIPLKDLIHLRRVESSWPLSDEFHYFEFFYGERMIYGCKTKENADNWVRFIYQGIIFTNFLDGILRKQANDELEPGDQDYLKHALNYQNMDEVELFDIKAKIMNDSVIDRFEEEVRAAGPPAPAKKKAEKTKSRNRTGSKGSIPDDAQAEIDRELKGQTQVSLRDFDIIKVLGSGAFGKVYKVKEKSTGKIFAMKALKKRQLILKNQLKYAITECNVLRRANSPFVLGLHYSFQVSHSPL
jgi:serum/glucocorticoid-regulated kinase 2